MALRLALRRPAATTTATAATPSPNLASLLTSLSGVVVGLGAGLGVPRPVVGMTETLSTFGASAREGMSREGGSTGVEAASVVTATVDAVAGCGASVTSPGGSLSIAEAGMGLGATAIGTGGLASR